MRPAVASEPNGKSPIVVGEPVSMEVNAGSGFKARRLRPTGFLRCRRSADYPDSKAVRARAGLRLRDLGLRCGVE